MRLFEKWILTQTRKYEIVSFDVYDTLIHRHYVSPHMVFDSVESKLEDMGYDEQNFHIKRCEAERLAHLSTVREEVTLDDIYNFYVTDKDCKEILKKVEIETEIMCVYPDRIMKRIFDVLIKENKKIIIISDMYLSSAVIRKVLNKAGYSGYEKIYVSSDIGLTKGTGRLFAYVLKENEGKSIIHIGDRFRSDYCNARENGMQSIWYAEHIKCLFKNV